MKELNSIREVKENFVSLLAENWALLTAKNGAGCNPMTVSWGAVGEIWGKDAVTVYVRQSRFTKELIDSESHFSLCFFDSEYKKALSLCGTKSGRDTDKVKETGLTPVYSEAAPYFAEAKLAVICRKTACTFLGEDSFANPRIKEKWYADGDMHTIYFGEIEKVLISE